MKSQYKIDTVYAVSGNAYYQLYKRGWFGWREVGGFQSSLAEARNAYKNLANKPKLPGTPEYLP